ncbi:MAG: DUF4359 domain-containing protein [Leptolyngbyaceae cyanobacterium SM1_3_5]|nr:DUF4359 domain-containing protein [Leptolyngbyaceae cyanobacterium SM1_3_5]
MKRNLLVYAIAAVLAAVGIGMAATNPAPEAYDDYATEQLTTYLKDNACTQAPNVLGEFLQTQCAAILEDNQEQIRRLIANNTDRQNWLLLSVYKTDLSVSDLLPSYHFETIGVFGNLYIYKAEQQ